MLLAIDIGNTNLVIGCIRDDQILGKLTAVIRQGREQDVANFGYRLKVNLWWVIYPLRAVYLWTRDMIGKIWQKIKQYLYFSKLIGRKLRNNGTVFTYF